MHLMMMFIVVWWSQELLSDKRDMDLEYVALKQNYIHINDDLTAERVKTEKIGVELLNLVNARQALETQNQRMQMELQQLRVRTEELNTSGARYNSIHFEHQLHTSM
jgi:hypothetical protein